MDYTNMLTEILKLNLGKDYTSVSFAIMKDGQIIAANAVGHRGDKEKTPTTTSDTFNVASVSKIYCTVAVMQLVEKGMLDLDTPICTYLPRFKMMDERYREITLRHCLAHTSGLPGTQWKGFTVSDVSCDNYYDEVYYHMEHSHLKAKPGEYAVYCNDGFTMAEIVVAQVSGTSFSKYCMDNITEPIGATSTRLSDLQNPNHTLVKEGKKKAEKMFIKGGAGFTTSMVDLCKFGQLFLEENKIISEKSKKEMASMQGTTFLPQDDRSIRYGLGWDNVDVYDPEYDLGEHVLLKGGNSFQFTTQFLIIPKYNAVLAISETHDCSIDVGETILRLFATAMLDMGVNIYTKQKPIPKEMIKKYQGTYIMPSTVAAVNMYGTTCNISRNGTRGMRDGIYKNLKFNGTSFEGADNADISFVDYKDDVYIFNKVKGRNMPVCMKAREFEPLSKPWLDRVGKKYVAITASPVDMVIYEIMTGFNIAQPEWAKGVFVASFSGRADGGVYGVFESSLKPLTDDVATGFIDTPSNGSRDLLSACFEKEDGIEYCTISSYTYRDVDTLKDYAGQGFSADKYNSVYKITGELSALPEVPEGRRIMVLAPDLTAVYDTLCSTEDYKAVSEGYISFI